MTAPRTNLDVHLGDLRTFLAIVRCGSVSGAAREGRVSVSAVSKSATRLEEVLGVKLLRRAARAEPTDAGRRMLPYIQDIVSKVQALRGPDATEPPPLTVASSAVLSVLLVPMLVGALPGARIRTLDLPPGMLTHDLFDVALSSSEESWPSSWVRLKAGSMRKALYTTPERARQLGRAPVDPERLRNESFVLPIYSYQGDIFDGDDGCPLPRSERRVVYETQTALLAMELARVADQLCFAPSILSTYWVSRGYLVEVPVQGWDVRESLYLLCHAERVKQREQRAIREALETVLVRGWPDGAPGQ